MPRKQRDAFRAGVFMLLSVILIFVLLAAIRGVSGLLEPMQIHFARFELTDDLGGLATGDNIRLGGFTVGSVRSIELVTNDGSPYILVRFSMPYKYVLRQGAYVSVGGTLTGISWLNFTGLGTGDVLPSDSVLTGHPSSFSQITDAVSRISPRIENIITQFQDQTLPLADGDLSKVGTTIDTFHNAADNISGLSQNVNDQIPDLMSKYNRAMDSARYALEETGDTMSSGRTGAVTNINDLTATLKKDLPGLLSQVQSDLEEVHNTFTNTTHISGQASQLVDANSDRISDMIQSLQGAADNLKIFSVEIQHSPWRLLYKPSDQEMDNLNIYDAVREFNDAAGKLQQAADALKLSLQAQPGTTNQKQIDALMKQLNDTFGQFQKVQNQFWQQTKD